MKFDTVASMTCFKQKISNFLSGKYIFSFDYLCVINTDTFYVTIGNNINQTIGPSPSNFLHKNF